MSGYNVSSISEDVIEDFRAPKNSAGFRGTEPETGIPAETH
jgi:hypothetical protein